MTSDIISRTGMVIVLCLIQSLVLNNIHIFGIATPLLYIYMVVGDGQYSYGASCSE